MAQDTQNVDFRLSAQDAASPVFKDVQRGLDGLAKQAFDAKAILGTLGAAVSAQQFVSMILGATETTARYKDLAEIAGTTAERISGLEAPARLAGTSLDTIAASVARLGRSLGEARLGDVGKAGLFRALGIDPDDGRDAAEVMVDVARAISGMTDQTVAGKVANDLLGKSYAELRPFMRELTEQGGLVVRVTNEQAEAADRFRDNLARASLSIDQAKINLGNELLPVLNELALVMVRVNKEFETMPQAASGVRTVFESLGVLGANVAFTFKMVGGEIGVIAAQVAALARGDFAGFRLIGEEWRRDAAAARVEVDALSERILSAGKTIAEARDNWELMGKGPTTGSDAEARIRERMEFEKHYAERVAAARGFATRYADAIQLQNQLAQEAFKQGRLTDFDLIRQVAANEDARIQVLVRALNEERALHLQRGELAQAKIAQEKAAAAESARIANEAITQARVTSLESTKRQKDEEEAEAFRAKIATKVEQIHLENMTEMDLLTQQLVEKTGILTAWAGEDLERQRIANEQRELLEIQHQAKLGSAHAQGVLARRDFEQKTARQQTQIVLSEMLLLTQGVATHSRFLFNLNKTAGIANAIVNAYVGISKTLAAYPYPWNLAMAALHAVSAFAQVQQIRSASFGSSTSAPTIAGGTAVPVTPIEGPPPAVTTQPQRALPPPRSQVYVTLQGETNPTMESVRDLMKLIVQEQAYGAEIILVN